MSESFESDDSLQKEIEELKKRISDLEETEKLYQALFNRTNDAVFLINLDGTHRKVNKRALEMLGFSAAEIEGRPTSDFIAETEIPDSFNIKDRLYSGESIPIYERKFKRKDGSFFYGENDVTLVRDKFGNPSYFFSIVRDITERKEAHEKLERMAGTDHLTGLMNRRSMIDKIKEEIVRFERSRHSFVILLLDIDHFKMVNDRHGHERGDRVLQVAARSMMSSLRKQDFCCRWGGEEFLILLPETDLSGGGISGEKIRRLIEGVSVGDDGRTVKITVTIGVAEYRGTSMEDCINKADNALYQGKKAGRNRVILAY